MSNYRETFKRKEVKYRLDRRQHILLEEEIAKHLEYGSYGQGQINSIYFDTAYRDIIARSLEKPLYKEKLRLRWYGISPAWEADALFLEMKKKFEGIVYKRRVQITHDSAARLIEGRQPLLIESVSSPLVSEATQLQITHELEAFVKRYDGLAPSALITCERTAFEESDAAGLRITFDSELSAIDLMSDEHRSKSLIPAEAIMEIKCNGAYPLWLVEILNKTGAYPVSFSKYGEFYRQSKYQPMMKERFIYA